MPTPNPNFVASVPLQYVFRDKDTGLPLSAGVVRFYSDPRYTKPKNVYEISNVVNNKVTFVSLGAELTLSAIGTFVDLSGQNLIPYYWPWSTTPDASGLEDPGDPEPYFITVYNSSGVYQFSVTYWPPDCLSGSAGTNSQLALTQNQITNPQFSQISFTPIPAGLTGAGTYKYNVSGTNSFYNLAPGWVIKTSGTGTVTVSQLSLNVDVITEPPYALQITSSSGVTSLQLLQQINNNPRLLSNPDDAGVATAFINGGFAASAATVVPLAMYYTQSNGSTTLLGEGNTTADNAWAYFSTSNAVTVPNSLDNASGYIQVYITIPTNTTVSISSIQLVEVANSNIKPGYIQQSIPEQTSNLYWFDRDHILNMPIPSYTIGWDFPFNPCQQLGTTVAAQSLSANTSRYIADQTIAFEEVTNVLSYTFNAISGLTVTATGSASQFAIIQYLDATTANELLQGNMSVQISAAYGYTNDVYGYINLYFTTGTPLPSMTTTGNITSGASLVATMSNGLPATFNKAGGQDWVQVPYLGGTTPPSFNINNTGFTPLTFSGWNYPAYSGSTLPTFFAIVISFSSLPAATAMSIRYCTLCKGNIATPPPATNEAQTLNALQYYYEKSYNPNVNPGTASTGGYVSAYQTAYLTNANTNTTLGCSNFSLNYKTIKIATPLVTFYSEDGTASRVTGHVINGGVASAANSNINANTVSGGAWGASIGQYQTTMTANSAGPFTTNSGNTSQPYSAYINYHYVVDARFGVAL